MSGCPCNNNSVKNNTFDLLQTSNFSRGFEVNTSERVNSFDLLTPSNFNSDVSSNLNSESNSDQDLNQSLASECHPNNVCNRPLLEQLLGGSLLWRLGICFRKQDPLSDTYVLTTPSGLQVDTLRLSNAATYFNQQLPTGSFYTYIQSLITAGGSSLVSNGQAAVQYIVGAAILQCLICYMLIVIFIAIYGLIDWIMGIVLLVIGIEIALVTYVVAVTEVAKYITDIYDDIVFATGDIGSTLSCALWAAIQCFAVGNVGTSPVFGCCCPNGNSSAVCLNPGGTTMSPCIITTGTVVLDAIGSFTVPSKIVTQNSMILLTVQPGKVPTGVMYVSHITANESFIISSTGGATDAGVRVSYQINM
jgi:hypothetical protein